MALIKCSVCGHKISTRAHRCPKCGNPKRDDNLKSDQAETAIVPDTHSQSDPKTSVSPQPENQNIADDWYFVTPLGRNGPVNFEFLQYLASAGQISNDTKIWKAGFQDWVKFSLYKENPEASTPPEPPAIPEKPLNNSYIWILAFAPAWGTVIQIITTEVRMAISHKTLDYYSQMWWIVIAVNIFVSYIDLRQIKAAASCVEKINVWLCLLVPLYIYRRDSIAHEGLRRLWVWLGSLLFSVAVLMLMNSIYSQISSK